MTKDVSGRFADGDRAFAPTASSPQAVSPVPASIPSAVIPVITLWQPWASLVFINREYRKHHETRSFAAPRKYVDKRIAIHAAAKMASAKHISPELAELCYDAFGCGWNYSLPLGCILGTVRLNAPYPAADLRDLMSRDELIVGDWSDGRWAWLLTHHDPLPEPLPAKGKQGWWSIPASAIEARRAATGTGAVHESAVRDSGDAR